MYFMIDILGNKTKIENVDKLEKVDLYDDDRDVQKISGTVNNEDEINYIKSIINITCKINYVIWPVQYKTHGKFKKTDGNKFIFHGFDIV